MASVTNNAPTFSVKYLEAVRDVQYQLVAAFTFLVWDSILSFNGEVEHVWCGRRRYIFKWIYFYFRYFLLAVQIFHLVVFPYLSSDRIPDFLCGIWYRCLLSILQLSLCIIEAILATRAFVLFNRSRKVGILFTFLILLHLAVAVFGIAQYSEAQYFKTCILPYAEKKTVVLQASTIIAVQSIVISMTIFKHVEIWPQNGRALIESFLFRDATSNCAAIFLMCSISLAACRLDDLRSIAIAHWSISLISSIGCRLILNMEHFARRSVSEDEILLTSHISL